MKILLLCNKLPYPPMDGGSIATWNLLSTFSTLGNDVTVLAMNTTKHYYEIDALPKEVVELAEFHAVEIDTSFTGAAMIANLLSGKSYHVERFSDQKFDEKLIELLKQNEFDIVQLEGLYLSSYVETIRTHSKAKISMRAHNIEHEIWTRIASKQTNPLKRIYLNIQSSRLKKYEVNRLSLYDFLIPISSRDEEHWRSFGATIPIHTSPIGFNDESLVADENKIKPNSIFFIGALDWLPNIEGILWFLKNVWKKILPTNPELQCNIAGRNPGKEMQNLDFPNVNMLGEIEDAYEFMQSNMIMVVPLFAGSGMRVKIIEAMALEKTIISTTIGAEGIDYTNGENILIADTVEEFRNQLLKCLSDENLCKRIGSAARQLIIEKYEIKSITKSLLNFYREQIA
ncbi:MAG: glycosyltransferase [Bacteroidetes bacterium]|nr:glycosyltransferase [Bacteroidota bacterium]